MDLTEKNIDEALLMKYLNNTTNVQERSLVEAWLAEDKANEKTLLQVARMRYAFRTQQRIMLRNTAQALNRVHFRIQQRSRRDVIRKLVVAASLFIGFWGLGSLLWQKQQEEPPPQMITISTNAGMRSQLTLPDGTEVFLNAGSSLVYPTQYDKNERRVQLSGEAFFKVTFNSHQPFVVNIADNKMNIRVLGTSFNVQSYEKDSMAQITLIDGSVQLSVSGQQGNVQLMPSNMATYIFNTGQVSIQKINTEQVTGWMNGRLHFKDTPMPEVLRQLTHFYSVDFDIVDDVIHGYTFTGIFENRPLFQILEYMKISSKLEFTMLYPENQDIRKPIIRLKKEGRRN